VDEHYLSFAVDTAQTLGGRFWNPESEGAEDAETIVDPYDFGRSALQPLAAELSPAILRIGGTAADTVYYDLSDDPVAEPPEPYGLLLTAEHWDGFADFALDHDFLDDAPHLVGLDLPGPVDTYVLTAESLDSREISLNGTLLTLDADGVPPSLAALAERRRLPQVELPGRSMAFVLAPEADVEACR